MALSLRLAAVTVFENPLGARSFSIDRGSGPFHRQSAEFCNDADSVYGRRGPDRGSHWSYSSSGAIERAADFAARRIRQ
jgi:cutinase